MSGRLGVRRLTKHFPEHAVADAGQRAGHCRPSQHFPDRSTEQHEALLSFAQEQLGGCKAIRTVAVHKAEVDLNIIECKEGGCAVLKAGDAVVKTRCIDHKHDKACGNETAFYPPLVPKVKVVPAVATQHVFSGKGLNENWIDSERRSAYVGSFNLSDAE